jgi:hypothetical protein
MFVKTEQIFENPPYWQGLGFRKDDDSWIKELAGIKITATREAGAVTLTLSRSSDTIPIGGRRSTVFPDNMGELEFVANHIMGIVQSMESL